MKCRKGEDLCDCDDCLAEQAMNAKLQADYEREIARQYEEYLNEQMRADLGDPNVP